MKGFACGSIKIALKNGKLRTLFFEKRLTPFRTCYIKYGLLNCKSPNGSCRFFCHGGFHQQERTMRIKDVPQDDGLNKGMSEITYAVDENGRYAGVRSLGWEPKNIVNAQAWEVITDDLMAIVRMVRAGKRSPLAYHMAKRLMTIGLLASYVRLPRWRVKRHLKPSVFGRLKPEILQRYADVFGLTLADIRNLPETDMPLLDEDSP
jgi:hypothetical protein